MSWFHVLFTVVLEISASAEFCDTHLQLLFTCLQQAKDPKVTRLFVLMLLLKSTQVRSNVIITLGDMAFRFPNLIGQSLDCIISIHIWFQNRGVAIFMHLLETLR